MLACRPMLSVALATMAGALLARFVPGIVTYALPGWVGLALALVWFIRTPGPPRPSHESIPASYIPHIYPVSGCVARRGMNRFILLLAWLFFMLGAWRQVHRMERFAAARLPESRWVNAMLVAGAPMREHPGMEEGWRVPAVLVAADGRPADSMPLRLSGPEGTEFRRGDVIQARIRLDPPPIKPFPGAFDYGLWLEREGLATSAAIVSPRRGGVAYTVARLERIPLDILLRRLIDTVRGTAIARTLALGGEHGPMLAAMLYGYRSDMADDLRDTFRRTGIGHVLAISGLHVGLIVGLLWWLTGWMSLGARWRACLCLVLVIIYLGLSGGRVAATRATVMAVIHLTGIALGRRGDMLNSLGLAAWCITLANPVAPLDVSFQLSFVAVVFIYMAWQREPEAWHRDAPEPGRRVPVVAARVVLEIRSLVRLSLFVWLGLFPIIAMVFNQVNLIGLPLNIVVIPLMSLVLAGGLLLPWLGWIPGAEYLLCLPAELLTRLVLVADRVPHSSFPAHAPEVGWVALFYGTVFLWLLRGMLLSHVWRRRWSMAVSVLIAGAFMGLTASMRSLPPPPGGRLALLPGRGFGVVVAEAEDGGIALLGSFARSGINEAAWLHAVRRDGPVATVAVATGVAPDLATLSFHYPIAASTVLAAAADDFADADRGWQPVPGAQGVEYAVSRDADRRLVWLAVRTGGRSLCVAPRLSSRQLTWRLERSVPGYDADLLALTLAGRNVQLPLSPMPPGTVALGGRIPEAYPAGWFNRRQYGALVVVDAVQGFDGRRWRPVP